MITNNFATTRQFYKYLILTSQVQILSLQDIKTKFIDSFIFVLNLFKLKI